MDISEIACLERERWVKMRVEDCALSRGLRATMEKTTKWSDRGGSGCASTKNEIWEWSVAMKDVSVVN